MPVPRSGPGPVLARICTLSLLSLCLTITPAQAENATRRPGEILDLHSGQTLSPDALYEQLHRRKLILIGEQHDNPEHHAVESLLLEELVTPGTPAVLEMLGPDLPLDELGVTTSKDELETALHAGTQGWDWDSYGRLYHQILQQGGKLVSGNLGRDELESIYRGDDARLPQRERDSASAIGDDIRNQIGAEITEQHCEPVPDERLNAMVDIQIARDARMASQLEAQQALKPAVLVAGSYHVRKDVGVPQHLQSENSAVVLLASVEDSGKVVGGDALISDQVADYIWFTSAIAEEDYCAGVAGTTSGAEAAAGE